ncbi:MAG: hypothetical protein IJ204_05630 [Paludibacteraceae bacterium]|nr:hypothetical protein [Paludibacteraceae bacterium]
MDFEQYWTLIGGDVNFADRKQVATKHGITAKRLHYIFVWFYREAKKRGKYDFLEKFFTSEGTPK